MRLVRSLLLLACLSGTGLTHPVEGGGGEGKLTWAEVLGVESSPSPSSALVPGGDDNEYYYYEDDENQGGGGGEDAHPFYEYVDTEDPSYTPPPPPDPDTAQAPETANRRTLDLLYHWFLGPKHGDARDSKPRPSLIEEVFQTIDNHIIEDLREWNSNAFSHVRTKPAIAKPTLPGLGNLFQSPPAPAAPPQQSSSSSSEDDALLVTDARGKEHLVTIDDIVASLGHLDERTLTELLLGTPPQATAREDVVVPQAHAQPQHMNLIPVLVPRPQQVIATPHQQIIATPQQQIITTPQQQVLLAPVQGALGELARPVRHTGPVRAPPQPVQVAQSDDDVYVVRDETGAVQVVTLQDIMASLSALEPSTANQLLFGEGAAPVLPPLPTGVLRPNSIAASNDKDAATTTTTTTTGRPTAAPLPTVNTDLRGDIHVRAHPGSVTLDLQSGDWETKAAQEEEEAQKEDEKDASTQKAEDSQVMADGSLVRRDENGNIHITPDPSRPFTLDVKNIISMAEKAEGHPTEGQKKEKGEEGVEEGATPSRGHELLSFLGGGRDSLPTAIPPQRPFLSSPVTVQGSPPASLLLQSLGRPQSQQAPAPAPTPALSEGLGSRLSGFLLRLMGREPEQPVSQPASVAVPAHEPVTASLTPEDEYVQLVLRQQNRDAPEAVFGDVLIPLPQPIHHQTPSNPPVKREAFPSGNKDATEEEEEEEAAPTVSPVLGGLPQRVLDTLRSQLQNVPRFIPPALRVVQQQAEERSDTEAHNEVASLASTPLEALAARVSAPAPSVAAPPPSSRPSVPYSSSSPVLSKLPPYVLRQILLQAAQRKQNDISKTPVSPRTPDKPQDRSSYAEVPSYEGVTGGYGYGGGSSDSSEHPLFDIFFLADATSLYKVGDTNLSLDTPKIGDPKNFVDTRHPFGYHYGLTRPHGYQQSQVYQQPYTYPQPVVTYSYY